MECIQKASRTADIFMVDLVRPERRCPSNGMEHIMAGEEAQTHQPTHDVAQVDVDAVVHVEAE